MLGRGTVLRAGGRQLTRVLSGQQSESSPKRCCEYTGAQRSACTNTASPGPSVFSSSTTTMSGSNSAYPTLEKLGLLSADHVRIKDLARVEELLDTIVADGFSKLQLVVDFDFTLTRVHLDGQRLHCSWGIMENSPNMPEYYREEAHRLLSKYYPIEVHPKMTEAEKLPYMEEWYGKIHDLLVKCTFSKTALKGMVAESNVQLRDGTVKLCNTLHQAGVPVLVLSAGMGDVLEEVLRRYKVYTDNVKVVSNFFKYNEEGIMVDFQGKLIHTFNKNEDAIHSSNYFEKLCGRTNVILMGDSLGDIKMARGVPQPSRVLKIGFLNVKIDERLETFMDTFDIVLLDDQTMDLANAIVSLMK